MLVSWNSTSVLSCLVLWPGIYGVLCSPLGVRRKNFDTSGRLVQPDPQLHPFRTAFKVFKMSHLLTLLVLFCLNSGKVLLQGCSGDPGFQGTSCGYMFSLREKEKKDLVIVSRNLKLIFQLRELDCTFCSCESSSWLRALCHEFPGKSQQHLAWHFCCFGWQNF